MGTNIYGWVEVKLLPFFQGDATEWKSVLDIDWLHEGRDYDSFGCFFGVCNYARFRPIAPERGLPDDVSPIVKQEIEQHGKYAFGQTWITWREIKQIDWDEEAIEVDTRIKKYERDQQGELRLKHKAQYEAEFAKRVGYNKCIDDQEQEWDLGDVVYRRERMKRKEVKKPWEELFHFLEILANRYGDESVRLVVWFS